MFVVVSYDIPQDKRRRKVMKTLEGFGTRVQYSVFECRLKPQDLNKLYARLKALIVEKEDDVRFYLLCEQCVPRIGTLGRATVTPTMEYVIVG
ncbi:MAG TPA: CRISPR-associated endonuclease Cas2 [Anaerolineae bacterium]|nr:CRISPR-associated endonuclease Cas2 [Anaerolineae bacterium]